MDQSFPRTSVGGISLSRMIIGTNWLLGYSHTGPAADSRIKSANDSSEAISRTLEVFLENGVDTIMGPLSFVKSQGNMLMHEAIQMAQERKGKRLILIDLPVINVSDSAEERKETYEIFKQSKSYGADICLVYHSNAEELVDKGNKRINRIDDYTKMIRDLGMVPGLSAHMPELIIYSDLNQYDFETYVQIYNCAGFLMQVEIENVARIIHNAKKPVITIKPMAAGRLTPYVGLNFVWNTIRTCDMVAVGCMMPQEAGEVIEISRAALEHRFPKLGERSSPCPKQAAFGQSGE
jgi:hypothetical protein